MKMHRFSYWRSALADYLHTVAHAPFEPGKHDCALFVAGAVHAMTGKDLSKGYRGKYNTLAKGLVKLKKKGFEDHIDLVASLLEEVPVAMLAVGDVASIETEDGPALGVVQGERIYFIRTAGGIGTVSLTDASRGFRVPFKED